jgi:transposase
VIQAFHCDGGLMTRRRYELTDGEWLIIAPLLPNKPRGVPRVDDRRVLNGILWRFRTGSPWAEIPERYGPSTTCYNRFVRWRKAGVWGRLLSAVSAAFEGEIVMIDSTCVRVHQHGATGKKGDPQIAAWDVPEAASRARSMPSLMLTVVPSPCA